MVIFRSILVEKDKRRYVLVSYNQSASDYGLGGFLCCIFCGWKPEHGLRELMNHFHDRHGRVL